MWCSFCCSLLEIKEVFLYNMIIIATKHWPFKVQKRLTGSWCRTNTVWSHYCSVNQNMIVAIIVTKEDIFFPWSVNLRFFVHVMGNDCSGKWYILWPVTFCLDPVSGFCILEVSFVWHMHSNDKKCCFSDLRGRCLWIWQLSCRYIQTITTKL